MKNLYETARDTGNFKTLTTAMEKAGLTDTLKGHGPYTVFAPTDEAFAKMSKAEMDTLLQSPEKLKHILLCHMVPGKIRSGDVKKMHHGDKIRTASNKEFTLGLQGGKVQVDKATITRTDIDASNGVMHAIDTVIMPH